MTTISSVILVDKRIQDHETIVAAIKADGVRAIVFDVADIDAQGGASSSASASASFEYILDKIAELGATSFSNIGIVQHNTGAPFHRFFAESQGEVSTIAAVETTDPTLQTWAGFAAFITTLKTTYGVQNVDLMACALYSDPNWKYVIDTLAVQTGTTVRASTDDTGAAALGGDWFLESHTGVNLKDVYFTEAIEEFRGMLNLINTYDSRSYSTKSFAPGRAFAWGTDTQGGDTSMNITGGSLSSNIIALYGTQTSIAALRTDGSVVTWGSHDSGGLQHVWSGGAGGNVAGSLTSGVTKVYTNEFGMAALKTNGAVITWGLNTSGGNSASVSNDLSINVVDVFTGEHRLFAALKSNGGLVTWGTFLNGTNDTTAVSSLLSSGVVTACLSRNSAAALKNTGRVITWGTSGYGGNSSSVAADISAGVVALYSDYENTFAVLRNDNTVVTWGYTTGMSPLPTSVNLNNVVSVYNTYNAYAVLKLDGSVVTWGGSPTGGNSNFPSTTSLSTAKVVTICSNYYAFAALTSTGNVITWGGSTSGSYGGNSSSVSASLTNVVALYSTSRAFAALKNNGQVITWGDSGSGGTSTSVSNDISRNVVAVYSNQNAFTAVRKDGRAVIWGGGGVFNVTISTGGTKAVIGGDLNSGIVSINKTYTSFAAIQSTETTFDLSASYYTDNDRYDILRNKENRRRVNLTTLNNNVFTLSSARDIERFNYTIPSGVGPFRIIVPDFVDSSYSITSTASIPSPAAANYIIACEEGEPVTISGTTYINYGAFVYRRNADNTFTKMLSATIGGLTYNLYGGDGINSSGIALRYRFGAFTVPTKTAGDASFNLTAPVSDSSGAITFTSSNTNVATVTSGGEVTIVAAGTTTITSTQAASGSWPSDSITASLVVSKLPSTLGALTVPAKNPSDVPFVLTAPTSTISSIISPVYTITSTATVIVPPPDIWDISYGTTWGQLGSDILGTQAGEYSGGSVSVSADGTVVAIGSYYYDKAGGTTDTGTTEGRVRVYKYNGTSWDLLGADILGTQVSEYSGFSVSVSADGTTVAIGSYYYDKAGGTTNTGTNEGRTRIYKYNGTSWGQMGLDISGTQISELSGYSVTLSADGTTVAIGSHYYDITANANAGRVRIYKYIGTAWTLMGSEILGTQVDEESGWSVSLSADGTIVAIGSRYYDTTTGNDSNEGRTRIYKYNGTSWGQMGLDISGTQVSERSGWSVSLSADGTTVAIGSHYYDVAGTNDEGRVRIYKYNNGTSSWSLMGAEILGTQVSEYSGVSVSLSADGTTVAIGSYLYDKAGGTTYGNTNEGRVRVYKYNGTSWGQIGSEILGTQAAEYSGYSVSLSADGTTVAIGSQAYDTTGDSVGRTRVYRLPTTNALTYSSSSSSIADVCGNLLLIKGVNGTSTITASQTGNTVTGRLDVSGTTYTLQYNPFTYTISDASLASVSTYGTVTLTGAAGTSTITATQPATRNYESRSVSGALVVSKLTSTLGELTVPAKIPGDAPFALTAPTSSISSIISPTHTITSTASVIVPPPDIWDVTYGTAWGQLGSEILGTQASEYSGLSVSVSADGTVVAIGSYLYDKAGGTTNTATNEGRTRIYKYNGTAWTMLGSEILGTQVSEYSGQNVSLSADGNTVAIGSYLYDKAGGTTDTATNEGRTRIYKLIGTSWAQLGLDISGTQTGEYSGESVSLSADGTTVAIGSRFYNVTGTDEGRTRVYKYNGTSWGQLGLDISGNQTSEESGWCVSLSADGTTVAIGARYYDKTTGTDTREGRTRVYKYNNGTLSWGQLGLDISGTQVYENSGYSVSLSADGTTVAIGSYYYDKAGGTTNANTDEGRTRIYKYNNGTSSWTLLGSEILGTQASEYSGTSVSLSADGNTVAIGSYAYDKVGGTANTGTDEGRVRIYKLIGTSWTQLGLDISGTQVGEYSGTSVSLSADGNTVAIGSYAYDKVGGTANAGTTEGRVRVYKIATTNALTYSSSSSSIADVCGNLLLIKGVNGTSTITASQTGNTVTGRLDVSGTTYTLQYNPFTYTISDASLATVSTYGTVTLTGGVGTSTVTATQPATRNYESRSVSGSLVVSKLTSTLGELTVPAKIPSDVPFALTAPTSSISSIISPVNTITSTATVIVPPPDIWDVTYGTTWGQLGLDISGTQASEESGYSVSLSADGTVVAIGSRYYDKVGGTTNANTQEGRTRVYKYNGTSWGQMGLDISGTQAGEQSGWSVSLSADGTIIAIGSPYYDKAGGVTNSGTSEGRTRIYKYNGTSWTLMGTEILGTQAIEICGISVTLSADGTTVAIGSQAYDKAGGTTDAGTDEGRVRIYKYNGTSWGQLGLDISGTQAAEYSGNSVSLSADGTTVAIGSFYYDKTTGTDTREGRTRIYNFNGTLWTQLGLDISGTQVSEQSGISVSLSADGTTVAIGSHYYDKVGGTTNANTQEGRTRVYKYNGTSSWTLMGSEILGTQANEYSGNSVSLSADGTIVAIGSYDYNASITQEGRTRIYKYNGTSWGQLGLDISGNQTNEYSGASVSLSADGTVVAIGSYYYDKAGGTTNTGTNEGRVRIYRLNATTNALTYSSSSSSIADVCGNLLLIKGVNGTSTITASQTGNTVTGRLDVSGTTYTLQYNPFTYTISDASLATVSTYGTVTLTGGVGTSTVTATQPATRNYESRSVSGSLVVSFIAPTIGALTAPAKNFGASAFDLTSPTSNSGGAFTYTSSNTAVATVTSGGTVTVVGAGTTTITATQAASGNYATGAVTASLVVSAIAPTIGTLTAPAKNFGDAAFDLTAPTSNSDGAFTYESSDAAVATVTSGGTVTIVGAGSTTITATQAATTNYTSGSVTASLVVSAIAPTIGTLTAPAKNFGDAAFDLTAPTSNSDGAFTYESSDAAVATVTSGGTVTIVGAGSTTITATQAATTNYTSGSVTASLVVSAIAPTIGTLTAPAKNFGASAFNLTAPTSNSGGAFTYESSDAAVATVTSGGRVTVVGAGTTTITATQAATTNYTSGSVTASLVVSAIAPTIGTLTAPAKNFGDAAFDLTAPTSNSDGAFTYESSDAAVATVTSGGTVTVVGAGTTTITASQASTTNYLGGSVTASLVVSAIAPTIGDLNAPAKNFGDAAFDLTAPTSNSDGAFTYESSDAAVATVTSGGRVTVVGAGTTTITASQASTTNYTSGSVTASLVVSAIAPTIGALTAPAKNFGDAAFDLTAPTSNSGGAFTYESSDAAVATVTSGGRVTVVGAGSTTITASQAATTNYTSGSVTASLVVSAIAPTIGALTAPAKNFGDASFNLTAPTSNSDGAFTYESSDAAVATVTSGGMVTIIGAGSTTITASQAASADGNYTGGSSVTASLVVSPIAPTYQSISQITKIYSTDVSFSLTSVMSGVSNSSGAYTFSTESAAIDICGGVATILAYTPSAITITATQAASGNYNGAGSTTFTVLVNRKVPSYGAFSVPAATYEDAPFSIAAYAPTTDSVGVPFTYTSSEPTVATINSDGTVITIIGQGYTTITASQDASGNYAASSTTTSFLVNRAAPTFLKAFTITNKTFGDASFSLLPFTEGLDNTDGTYHFTSSNAQLVSISEVDGVTATILAYTPTPITIYVAIDACGNYAASSTSGSLTVLRAIPTFGAFTVPAKNFRDASFNLTAPTSDSSGTFTYTSSDAAVATVTSDGGVVTIVGAGSTTITATQEINGNYTTRDISASLVVSPIAPTIGALSAPAKNFGDASFNLTAPTSDSSGAFTYTSSNTAVATVTSSGTVTIVGVGTTTITATQAASADGNYTTGSVTASLVVSASLGNFTVPAKTYGDASFNLVDPETTDNTVGFTFASSNTSVATLSGRTVTIVGAGSTTITATQAATANRGELNISATLVVSKAQPVITIAAITKSYGNPSFRPVPSTTNTDTSGGSVFTFSSNNIAVVSMLDATLVRINGIGTATLSITQAASANFTNATSSVVVTVNKGISGFSASTFAVASNKTFGDAAFAITTKPISSSTGAITYSSSDEAVATVTSDGSGNNAITLVGQGTVTFTASQAESALYTADTKTSNTLTVARKTAVLSRDTPSTDTITKYYGDATFTVSATNESNGAFSYSSSDPSFATIDASTGVVTIVAVGSSTLTAARAQTAQYNAASVSWTLNIARGTTTLTGLSSLTRNVTVAPFSVSASSASNGAVSYALQDTTSTVLTIHPTSGLVRLKSPGSAVIVASQAQGTFYEAPTSITATITVNAAGNSLQGGNLTGSNDFANVDLSGASLANTTITNTNFSSSNLENSNFNNSNVSNADMSNADLSGSTMRDATMSNVDFTNANLQGTDLSGANVLGSIFNNANLSGSTLSEMDASGASFVNADLRGANLSNADFTNADMTNANISGANITNVTFTIPQKLQLLKNEENRTRPEIQVSQTVGSNILAVISNNSEVRNVPNIANATIKVIAPTTKTVFSGMNIIDIVLDTDNYTYFYFPIKDDEYFRIQGTIYRIDTTSTPPSVRNFTTGAAVENTSYGAKAIRLLAGSLTIIVNSQNTLASSSFVVPSMKQTNDAPFSPTTLPTSNSAAPIVYSSSNTSVATINSSTGLITLVADSHGFVRFTASQVATETHESASITSNDLFVNKQVDFTLPGLNQTFSLSTLASLDASSVGIGSTDATAVFYVRLSDMTNLFQYQTDAFDVNNTDASDIKYYVFHKTIPTAFHINPSHAMMNKTESAGMLGTGVQEIVAAKSLVKHDFIRYIAFRLFNTHYGVDLFENEKELQENITYLGETVQHNIDTILSGISTTSANESLSYDASGNKYLTNDSSGNTNLCRELMRQIAAAQGSRFYNNGADTATSGLRPMPLHEDDSINFKLTVTAAEGQNIVTGVSVIPSRTYTIKMVLKNTVNTSSDNTNTPVTDSEMYPNSYPYSTSVVTYAPTAESADVYNEYSPPAPIPTSRFGYNGWYYANTSAWVNVAQAIRDRVKWVVPSNSVGSSTVGVLRYIRMNLKVFNKTSLPFLVVTTQAGSTRKYTISAPNSLANGTVYSFYMNFNSYAREPATVGSTNAELTYSNVGSGSFANGEVITSIAVETDGAAAASSVEFTLSSVVVGEASGEKEYGFSANV